MVMAVIVSDCDVDHGNAKPKAKLKSFASNIHDEAAPKLRHNPLQHNLTPYAPYSTDIVTIFYYILHTSRGRKF